MKKTSQLLLLSALSISVGNLLQATLLSYEGFDSSVYNTTAGFATDNLSGQGTGSGSGFTGNWGAPTTDGQALGDYWLNSDTSSAAAYYNAATGQASYTDGSSKTLVTTAGQSTFTGDGTRVSLQKFTTSGPTSGIPALYLSALVTLDGGATDLTFGSAFRTGTGNPRAFNFGFTSSGNLAINAWQSGSTENPVSVSATSAGTYAAGTYLLVARVAQSLGSGDTLEVWVNPLLGNELGSGAADLSVNGAGFYVIGSTWSMDGLVVDSTGTGSISFDELRVGTSWDDVTPSAIPEASTLVLSMVSLLTFIGLRSSRNRR